jgi:hypothetical protein
LLLDRKCKESWKNASSEEYLVYSGCIYIVPNITGCSKLNTFPSTLNHNNKCGCSKVVHWTNMLYPGHGLYPLNKVVNWTAGKVFNLEQPVIFGTIYIQPEYTRYSSDEAFNQIEHELHSFSTYSK